MTCMYYNNAFSELLIKPLIKATLESFHTRLPPALEQAVATDVLHTLHSSV